MKAFFLAIVLSVFLFSCQNKETQNIDSSKLSINELSALILKDSTAADLYFDRGQRFLDLDLLDSAILDFEKAVKINSENVDWKIKLSDVYLLKGQSENARRTLDDAIKLEPNHTEALFKMGVLYLLIEDHMKSFEYLNQALSIDPNLEKIYFYKSLNYAEIGDTTRALNELLKAVEKNPEYTEAYIQLGLYSDALNDTMARVYFKNALKIDSTNAFAHYDLAFHYQNQKEFDKAIAQYLYIVNHIDSTFSIALHNIGYIYLVYSDDLETAISYFDKAIAIDFNYTEAYSNKAYALELLGRYRESFVEYQTALKITPDHFAAQKGLERISKQLKLKK